MTPTEFDGVSCRGPLEELVLHENSVPMGAELASSFPITIPGNSTRIHVQVTPSDPSVGTFSLTLMGADGIIAAVESTGAWAAGQSTAEEKTAAEGDAPPAGDATLSWESQGWFAGSTFAVIATACP